MKRNLCFGLTLLLLGSSAGVTRITAARKDQPLARPLSTLSPKMEGWDATEDPVPSIEVLRSLSASSYVSRTYRRGDRSINLWVAFYANQHAGETMHSPKYCLPGAGWELNLLNAVPLTVDGRQNSVNEYILARPGERSRMLYWYQARERVVANEYAGKLYLMWDALRYGRTSGSIARVIFEDNPEARQQAIGFAGDVMRGLAYCFGN